MKFMDCALSTAKTVFLVKNKYFISSVMNSLAAALFIFVADKMANATDDLKIYIAAVVFLANLIGGYMPPKLISRLEKDRLFIYNITSDTLENGKMLADKLRELNIPVSTATAYDKKMNKVLICNAYAVTREQSKLIDSQLTGEFKYNIIQAM